jgi:hypothetical protein
MTKRDELQKMRAHQRVWQRLFRKVDTILGAHGQRGYRDGADYWIVDDDWGWDAVQVEMSNLDLLRNDLIDKLQTALRRDPDWRIMIGVYPREKSPGAPGMGLTIYCDEIVDELQRDFLPARFRDVVFGRLGSDIKKDIAERVRQLMNKPPTS